MSENIFTERNCIGNKEIPQPHNIIFTPVKTQTRQHPEMEGCVEESVIEGIMYCTKCGLTTPETIDFGEETK